MPAAVGGGLKVARAQEDDEEETTPTTRKTTPGLMALRKVARARNRRSRKQSCRSSGTTRCFRRHLRREKCRDTVIDNIVQQIAPDISYAGWTFDGAIPGRPVRVVEGDTVNVTFKIDPTATWHSLDTHAARTAPDVNYRTIGPGEELQYSFVPKYPGSYMYHCGTPPVLMHIGAGMYGAMIVDPRDGWPPAQELVFVQSEFYLADAEEGDAKVPDYTKMFEGGPMDYVVFNGHSTQYVDEPIKVRVGEPIRIFLVNAGPNVLLTFHVVGAIFDAAYFNANPANKIIGQQSMSIGPGDGACVEFVLDEPGIYPAVNHAFGHAAHGAIALLQAE